MTHNNTPSTADDSNPEENRDKIVERLKLAMQSIAVPPGIQATVNDLSKLKRLSAEELSAYANRVEDFGEAAKDEQNLMTEKSNDFNEKVRKLEADIPKRSRRLVQQCLDELRASGEIKSKKET